MASLKGAKIAVQAPNPGTNRLLTSNAVLSMCAEKAAKVQARVYSETTRDTTMSTTEKKRRYPIIEKRAIASSFKGTRRAGVIIKGQQWGIRATTAQKALKGLK